MGFLTYSTIVEQGNPIKVLRPTLWVAWFGAALDYKSWCRVCYCEHKDAPVTLISFTYAYFKTFRTDYT